MKGLITIAALSWTALWLTPDQAGQRYFRGGDFLKAAEAFDDTMWAGTALYRAGEFEDSAQTFARLNTAESLYNQGTAWLMHGSYETAVACFDRALEKRPDWKDAEQNRALAQARGERMQQEGGDMGDQTIGADKVIFDKNANNEGQETVVNKEQLSTQMEIQAMWLDRVQTRPADFLKAKFAYQQASQQEGGGQ